MTRPSATGLLDFSAPPAVAPTGKATPGPAALRAWQGVVERFVYRDEAKGFAIVAVRNAADGELWTVKGALATASIGDTFALRGETIDDPKYGRQFRADSATPTLPTTPEAVAQYLKTTCDGVGAVLAARIVATLGASALEQIHSDPEALQRVTGLSKKKREHIAEVLQARASAEQATVFLLEHGFGPALVGKILARYGRDAPIKLRANPYQLADEIYGIGFRTADNFALDLGWLRDAPPRLRAGLRYALHDLAQQGHTAPPEVLVRERAAAILEVAPETLTNAITDLVQSKRAVLLPALGSEGEPALALPELAATEKHLAKRLLELLHAHTDTVAEALVERRLHLAEISLGFALQGGQRDAVAAALRGGVLVVTGGPGTGKTTIIRGVLAALAPDDAKVVLAAPTGRAARRLEEATGLEAKTLHRLLEFEPRTGEFLRDEKQPLDADVVIVDEVSMMEVPLAAALCDAVALGARLLLVGDADQLPSVGPGAVLGDLLASKVIPSIYLERIYRQGEGSWIVHNAHRVRRGELPVTDERGGDGDFFLIARDSPEDILKTIVEIITHRLPRRFGFDPIGDIQVLAPMHRGSLGTTALNEVLRQALNPEGEILQGGFRVGDKVIQLRNDYELDVFNGDIGRVVAMVRKTDQQPADNKQGILASESAIRVHFGDRAIDYPVAHLQHLQLAYAVTVHKAQGSEYPAVILPLHGQQHVMLQRNLLYTALTRGRRIVVLVGQPYALQRAASNDAPVHRHTRLCHELIAQSDGA